MQYVETSATKRSHRLGALARVVILKNEHVWSIEYEIWKMFHISYSIRFDIWHVSWLQMCDANRTIICKHRCVTGSIKQSNTPVFASWIASHEHEHALRISRPFIIFHIHNTDHILHMSRPGSEPQRDSGEIQNLSLLTCNTTKGLVIL